MKPEQMKALADLFVMTLENVIYDDKQVHAGTRVIRVGSYDIPTFFRALATFTETLMDTKGDTQEFCGVARDFRTFLKNSPEFEGILGSLTTHKLHLVDHGTYSWETLTLG